MTTYTVHVPEGAGDDVWRADRTAFVKDGFNRWAFLVPPLFLLWHRLWLAVAAWAAALAVIVALARVLHVPSAATISLVFLVHLFAGLEGNDLRRWQLQRRGVRLADIVAGHSRDEAERAFFHRQPPRRSAPASTPSTGFNRIAPPALGVIGMFPDERGR